MDIISFKSLDYLALYVAAVLFRLLLHTAGPETQASDEAAAFWP